MDFLPLENLFVLTILKPIFWFLESCYDLLCEVCSAFCHFGSRTTIVRFDETSAVLLKIKSDLLCAPREQVLQQAFATYMEICERHLKGQEILIDVGGDSDYFLKLDPIRCTITCPNGVQGNQARLPGL